ncbi:Uncharacterized protein APZ42_016863 [Daphnia magna]|uniref:Uncharacterized protein n=1 Tax=Daphnia magna TaxID=35525 RepID=A0A165A754_9CRUS|nr:Uncharacterized protein APZ42_016863 [Daphnia magna]
MGRLDWGLFGIGGLERIASVPAATSPQRGNGKRKGKKRCTFHSLLSTNESAGRKVKNERKPRKVDFTSCHYLPYQTVGWFPISILPQHAGTVFLALLEHIHIYGDPVYRSKSHSKLHHFEIG